MPYIAKPATELPQKLRIRCVYERHNGSFDGGMLPDGPPAYAFATPEEVAHLAIVQKRIKGNPSDIPRELTFWKEPATRTPPQPAVSTGGSRFFGDREEPRTRAASDASFIRNPFVGLGATYHTHAAASTPFLGDTSCPFSPCGEICAY